MQIDRFGASRVRSRPVHVRRALETQGVVFLNVRWGEGGASRKPRYGLLWAAGTCPEIAWYITDRGRGCNTPTLPNPPPSAPLPYFRVRTRYSRSVDSAPP